MIDHVESFDVLHVITRFIRGGADENTLLTCNTQARAGHRVRLVHGREFHADMLRKLDSRIEVIKLEDLQREIDWKADINAFVALRRILRHDKADIVHTHESKAGIIGRMAARLAKVPIIVHGVHILPHLSVDQIRRRIYLTAERIVAPATDAFIDVSVGMRDECLAARLGSAERHHVIESGMDIARFKKAAPLNRTTDSGLSKLSPEDPILILIAGALEGRKRVGEFLDVFAKLAAQNHRLCLVLAGEGPERAAIEAKIAAYNLSGRVVCLGYRDDVDRLIATADICVHCAAREGLPRVVVQYVATGKPVVVTALPGIDAIVSDGENGFVTSLEDLSAMAEPLARLSQEPSLRARLGRSAKHDLSAWSADSMCDRINQVYARLAARKGLLADKERFRKNRSLIAARSPG